VTSRHPPYFGVGREKMSLISSHWSKLLYQHIFVLSGRGGELDVPRPSELYKPIFPSGESKMLSKLKDTAYALVLKSNSLLTFRLLT
jgi:hypothetical protein